MLGLLTLSAVAYAAGTVVSLLLVVEPAEQQLLFGATVSDWFWVLSALLFATLAVVISLILSMAFAGVLMQRLVKRHAPPAEES